jgi:hypothetical protein
VFGTAMPGYRRMGVRARTRRARLAAFTTILLGAGLAQAVAPTTATAAPAATPAPASPPTEAATADDAAWLAHVYGTPIEVLDERTELAQTFAQPDGSFTTRTSPTPVRVRRGGGWVPVDTTLQRTADGIAPVATTLDLHFSAGGSGPMLWFGPVGKQVRLTWPAALPVPVLSGPTATYTEVLPGVDLQLTANADSFGEVLVVKNATAARNPALTTLRFGIAGDGVTIQQADDKVIQAVDGSGKPVFVSDGAAMWQTPPPGTPEAPGTGRSNGSSVAPPGGIVLPRDIEASSIPVTLSSSTLSVTPSQAMLTGDTTTYPVYIDPGFNGGKEVWTVVSRAHPDTSYWTNMSMRDYMRVGQNWHSSSTDDWRTIVQFNIGTIAHTQILSASVLTTVWHTASCTASPLGLWKTLPISTSKAVTWNNTVSTSSTPKWWKLREVKASANKHECPKGNDEVEFGDPSSTSHPIRDFFQAAANADNATITLGFRAPDEGDEYQWKKLVKDSTYLDINYNRQPGVPTALAVSPCDHNPCTNPAKSRSRTPTLSMKSTDPDGGSLRYEYELYDSAKKVVKAKSGTAVTGVKSGTSKGWTVATADKKPLPDGQYYWRGRACDSTWCSDYNGWYGLLIDTTNPGAPKADAGIYRPTNDINEPPTVPGGYGGPGVPGTLTLQPDDAKDQVAYYMWWLVGEGGTHKVVPDFTGVGHDTVLPAREGPYVLKAYAVDAAGNRTASDVEYHFKVQPAGGQWVWHMDEGSGAAAGSLPVDNRPATATAGGVTWSDRDDGYALTLDGMGALATDLPVLNTTAAGGFTVAAWVRLAQDPSDTPPPTDTEGDPEPTPTDPDPGDVPVDPGADEPATSTPAPSVLDNDMTAVSEDGAHASMFRLGYSAADHAWCFTLTGSDDAAAGTTKACSHAYLNQGEWVHLVGVVDRVNNEIRIYVNGGPNNEVGDSGSTGAMTRAAGVAPGWTATGGLAIGRSLADGPTARWHGDIDDVYAVPRVWSDYEIKVAATPYDDFLGEEGQ